MRKTEQRNPKTMKFSEMDSLEMVKIINEENMNSVRAVEAALERMKADHEELLNGDAT